MSELPDKLKKYLAIIFLASIAMFIFLFSNYEIDSFLVVFFWILLSIITESLIILIPGSAGVSVGFAIGLACIITSGPMTAVIVTAIGFIFRVLKVPGRGYVHLLNTPFYKTLFNSSQSVIITGLAGITYVTSGGIVGRENFVLTMMPILLALLVYAVSNTILMAELMSLLTGEKFIKMWLDNIKDIFPSLLAVGTLGVIIALAYIGYGIGAVLLFFGPLLLARYSFKLYMDMRHVYMETVEALTKTIEAKDPYTSGHASRVGEYSVRLAIAMGLSDKKIKNIKTAALLHDIGKIGVDDSILKKPGKLSELEYQAIQRHPVIGAQILKDVDYLKEVVEIIKSHHERFDGKGYPDGIEGEDIPMEAAILSIADVYDAMTSDRPYRPALTKKEAVLEIEANSGTQFNPAAANVFVSFMKKEIQEELQINVN